MKDYTIVSFSGGKDSTAMLIRMIELGEHIDEVINVDTDMEFPEMYTHLEKVRKIVESEGIKYTTLRNDESFEYLMLHKKVESKKWGTHYGYGWPTPVIRWCTKKLKLEPLDRYLKSLKEQYKIIQCIGLAADEFKRLERAQNNQSGHRHPLVEWGWSESDCLKYCYDKGFDWGGLYNLFNRVSCWCCPLAALSELKKLWAHYPELWSELQKWENCLESRPNEYLNFRQEYTVKSLTNRFIRETKAERDQKRLETFGVMV